MRTPGEEGIIAAQSDNAFNDARAQAIKHVEAIRNYLNDNSEPAILRDWADAGTMSHYAAQIKEIHDEMFQQGEYA